MIQDKTLMIARVLETGSAFGHVVNTGESAFIPKAVVTATRLQEGEIVVCKVKENIMQADTVPWFVISISRDNHTPDETVAAVDVVRDEIEELGMSTVEEIAAAIGQSTRATAAACNELFNDGQIVKLAAYTGPDSGVVRTFYVTDLNALDA